MRQDVERGVHALGAVYGFAAPQVERLGGGGVEDEPGMVAGLEGAGGPLPAAALDDEVVLRAAGCW